MILTLCCFMLAQNCPSLDFNGDGHVYIDDVPAGYAQQWPTEPIWQGVILVNDMIPCLPSMTVSYPTAVEEGDPILGSFTLDMDFSPVEVMIQSHDTGEILGFADTLTVVSPCPFQLDTVNDWLQDGDQAVTLDITVTNLDGYTFEDTFQVIVQDIGTPDVAVSAPGSVNEGEPVNGTFSMPVDDPPIDVTITSSDTIEILHFSDTVTGSSPYPFQLQTVVDWVQDGDQSVTLTLNVVTDSGITAETTFQVTVVDIGTPDVVITVPPEVDEGDDLIVTFNFDYDNPPYTVQMYSFDTSEIPHDLSHTLTGSNPYTYAYPTVDEGIIDYDVPVKLSFIIETDSGVYDKCCYWVTVNNVTYEPQVTLSIDDVTEGEIATLTVDSNVDDPPVEVHVSGHSLVQGRTETFNASPPYEMELQSINDYMGLGDELVTLNVSITFGSGITVNRTVQLMVFDPGEPTMTVSYPDAVLEGDPINCTFTLNCGDPPYDITVYSYDTSEVAQGQAWLTSWTTSFAIETINDWEADGDQDVTLMVSVYTPRYTYDEDIVVTIMDVGLPPDPEIQATVSNTVTEGDLVNIDISFLNHEWLATPLTVDLISSDTSEIETVNTFQTHRSEANTYPMFILSLNDRAVDGDQTVDLTIQITDDNGVFMESTHQVTVLDFGEPCSSDPMTDTDGDGLTDCEENNIYGTNPGLMDTDGDSLPDDAEVLDLAMYGADPLVKDIFVECDWWKGDGEERRIGTYDTRHTEQDAKECYGVEGITLHIDYGQGYPFIGGNIVLDPQWQNVNMLGGTSDVWAVKAAHFDPERQGVFHYCFATDTINGGGVGGFAEGSGDEFAMANTRWAVFCHELGHNMGLHHGGAGNIENRKPNYYSIMNYLYLNGVPQDCLGPYSTDPGLLRFSDGSRPDLDENELYEEDGICGGVPIDWNENSTIETDAVACEIGGYTNHLSVLTDSDDPATMWWGIWTLPADPPVSRSSQEFVLDEFPREW